ncbi:MAG: hypothetical protein ACXAAH_08005, partial [Promethearchaeota archaeon]
MKRETVKYFGAIFIFLFIFSFMIMIFQNDTTIHAQRRFLGDDFNYDQTPEIAMDDLNGKSLQVEQYANISKSFSGNEFPKDISFTLAPDWTSKNVTINYEGVGIEKDWVSNGEFDSNISGWTYQTNNPSAFTQNGHDGVTGNSPGSAKFRMTGGRSGGDYAYFEQNISISEEFKSG